MSNLKGHDKSSKFDLQVFRLNKPDDRAIRRFLAVSEQNIFSYPEIGASVASAPHGYTVDHNRIKLGQGEKAFNRAKAAIHAWEMFSFPWIKLCYADTRIEAGSTVGILIRHFGFYSLNAARIVYVLDETTNISRFGFAYGTLTDHGEIGEERFSVEMDRSTGEVWYDLFAFSRPGSILAKVGYPLSRALQRAFAVDSQQAMLKAVDRSV